MSTGQIILNIIWLAPTNGIAPKKSAATLTEITLNFPTPFPTPRFRRSANSDSTTRSFSQTPGMRATSSRLTPGMSPPTAKEPPGKKTLDRVAARKEGIATRAQQLARAKRPASKTIDRDIDHE